MAVVRNRGYPLSLELPRTDDSNKTQWLTLLLCHSTIARSFSAELMDIFRIENSVADLDEQIDKRSVAGTPLHSSSPPRRGRTRIAPANQGLPASQQAADQHADDGARGARGPHPRDGAAPHRRQRRKG
jgi:hypothetical protein